MDMTLFLFLLFFFSALTSIVVEGIKNTFLPDIETRYYNIVAVIVALVIGVVGTFLYFQFNSIALTVNNVIFAILMGLASALASMVGYDKVHDVLKTLKGV